TERAVRTPVRPQGQTASARPGKSVFSAAAGRYQAPVAAHRPDPASSTRYARQNRVRSVVLAAIAHSPRTGWATRRAVSVLHARAPHKSGRDHAGAHGTTSRP